MMMMMKRIVFACLLLSLFSGGSSLSCRWLDHKFRQYNEKCLELLDAMQVNNSTKPTVDDELEVDFPHDLYNQTSKASTRHRLVFIVQVLREVFKLLEKNHSSASWEEQSVENFLNLVIRQTHELRHCIGSHSHKWKNGDLAKYFHALSNHITKMNHSAEVWEVIREEIKLHLFRVNQLASSLMTNN